MSLKSKFDLVKQLNEYIIYSFSALRNQNETFLLNGDTTKIAENGLFSFNNDTFDYSLENGLLTSRGPLSRAVSLMVRMIFLNCSGI